jgi:glycosyltransferase involved in cell wall biosynthesis
VNFKGLSRSRNYALNLARGSYFALIDDDASYDQLYLMRAYEMFKNNKNIVLSGFIKNLKNSIALKDYLNVRDGQELNIRQIVRMAPSPALIFPYSLYQKGARFDENFGVGAQYGACEETDFILQSLDFGYKVKFSRKLLVFHPTIDHSYEIENDTTIKKIENYASGLGALIAKDKYIRKNNRLRIIRIEKLVKLILKKTGILGSKNKFEAMAEWKGFCYGFKKFVKESV